MLRIVVSRKSTLLAIVNVVINGIVLLTNLYILGVGINASHFMLSTSILSSIFILMMMVCEQFPYEYGKIQCKSASMNFYVLYSIFGIAIGLVLYSGFRFSISYGVLELFFQKNDKNDMEQIIELFIPLNYVLIIYVPYQLALMKLTCDGRIVESYIYGYILPLAQLIAAFFYTKYEGNLPILAWGIVSGYVFGTIALVCSIRPKIELLLFETIKLIWTCTCKSFAVKSAHNIHNFVLIDTINKNVMLFGGVDASIFLYLKKLSEAVLQVIYTPIHKQLIGIFPKIVMKHDWFQIKSIRKKIDIESTVAVLVSVILTLTALSFVCSHYNFDLWFSIVTFFSFSLINLILCIELPSAIVNLCSNNNRIFIVSNTVYVTLLLSGVWMLESYTERFYLIISMVFSQLICSLIIRTSANRLMRT